MIKFLLLSLFITLHLYGIEAINGTITILEFDAKSIKTLSKDGIPVPLVAHPRDSQRKIAFIAIPYKQIKPIELTLQTSKGKEIVHLPIIKGNYQQEELSVESSKVSPPKEALERIKQESAEATALYATFTPKRFWKESFEAPMQSHITSAYGNARVFNNSLQSYHSGTDFRAVIGTPIYASNDGVVALVKDRYYAGQSVIIDHGEGIYSVYYHLSASSLHVGDTVQKGSLIGLSGATGRITGPHLHFGFMVGGIPVDPLDFMAKVKGLL